MQNIVLGILFGIINTSVLHLAKGMERHGIEIFSRKTKLKEKGRKPLIYIIGFVLNNTIMIWQIIGTSFSSAAVFSSVFGLGLIVLMLYSHYVLSEKITKFELLGGILIIIGTTLVGVFYLLKPPTSENVNYANLFIFFIVIIFVFIFFITISWKKNIGIALIFGAVAGTFGGMDNVFKRIGLVSSNIIETFIGVFRLDLVSLIFLFSFFLGFLAFVVTQIGFAHGADASKLVPMYNSLYIISPIVIELFIMRDAIISIEICLSVFVIILGIFLMNIFKHSKSSKKNELQITV